MTEKLLFMARKCIGGCLAVWCVLVGCIGTIGVLHSWWPHEFRATKNATAIIFGSLLGSLVILHYWWRASRSPIASIACVREFCRRDSRAVYLLLFILVGVHHLGAMLNGSSVSGTADDLQGYLAAGVCALLLIRISGLFWLQAKP